MKKFVVFVLAFTLMTGSVLYAKGSRRSSSNHVSTKSRVPGSRDGSYKGGNGGSSHKGSKYKNSKTGNHDRNRKAGTPR
jgi:hypothetical protein